MKIDITKTASEHNNKSNDTFGDICDAYWWFLVICFGAPVGAVITIALLHILELIF